MGRDNFRPRFGLLILYGRNGIRNYPAIFATRNDIFVLEIIPPEIIPLAFCGEEKLSRVCRKLSRFVIATRAQARGAARPVPSAPSVSMELLTGLELSTVYMRPAQHAFHSRYGKRALVLILGAQGRAYGVEVTAARGWMGPPSGAPRANGATTHKVHPDKPGDHREVFQKLSAVTTPSRTSLWAHNTHGAGRERLVHLITSQTVQSVR